MKSTYSKIVQGLHAYAKNHQAQQAVLGLSGGLDSAVVLCLALRAFGAKNVIALHLPERGLTPEDDSHTAKVLTEHLGVKLHSLSTNNFMVDFNFLPWQSGEEANQHLKARIRALLLQHHAESTHSLLLGCANKSDLALGLGDPHGEFIGDIHPIGDLLKSDVLQLAEYIGLPDEIIQKDPSRCLHPKMTDQSELNASWAELDTVLRPLLLGADPETLIQKGLKPVLVHRIVRLMDQAKGSWEHLKTLPVSPESERIQNAQAAEASSC